MTENNGVRKDVREAAGKAEGCVARLFRSFIECHCHYGTNFKHLRASRARYSLHS